MEHASRYSSAGSNSAKGIGERAEAEEAEAAEALEGLFGRPGASVRYGRAGGEFVFSVIDLAMVAKDCDYKAAQKLVWRLAEDYFEERMGENRAEHETTGLLFRTILFDGQRGRPTPCLTVDKAVEFLMIIPGSEISADVRREAAQALVRRRRRVPHRRHREEP